MGFPGANMRNAVLSMVLMLPLLGGCSNDNPLVPELKGRWATPYASKICAAVMANRLQIAAQRPAKDDADCREQYVVFDKQGILLHIDRKTYPLFAVKDVKRSGARLTLTGDMPVPGAWTVKIELLLRGNEVRFDDIIDEGGRSIRYKRFDDEEARRVGVTNLGELFRMVLDVKPCRV